MLLNQTIFIGIIPTIYSRPFTYAALDRDKSIVSSGQGDLNDVLEFLAGQETAYVAIGAPRRPAKDTVESVKASQSPLPSIQIDEPDHFRLAEYQLRQQRILVTMTPIKEEDCPLWMRRGFEFYKNLNALGYQPYPTSNASHQWLEVNVNASYWALLGHTPLSKNTLEGRLQRQLILCEAGLKIPDPMYFFEEVTRHKLLQGYLPLKKLYRPGELDALAAAYTARIAAIYPQQVTAFGDSTEGLIYVPAVKPPQ